jgi:hypothetical protein
MLPFLRARFSEASTYAGLATPLGALAVSEHALGAPLWICITFDILAGLCVCAAVVIGDKGKR